MVQRKDLNSVAMAPLPSTFEARLAQARALTPSVRELVFERTDAQAMSFVPGQWVSTALATLEGGAGHGASPRAPPGGPDSEDPDMRRSYSIASAPDGSSRFELAVTHVQGGPGAAARAPALSRAKTCSSQYRCRSGRPNDSMKCAPGRWPL